MTGDTPESNHLEAAARDAENREKRLVDDPEPSLGRRFGQIGILGWMIVFPVLVGIFAGGWLDRMLGTGILLSAALTMVGAALGLWFAIRWMHDQ